MPFSSDDLDWQAEQREARENAALVAQLAPPLPPPPAPAPLPPAPAPALLATPPLAIGSAVVAPVVTAAAPSPSPQVSAVADTMIPQTPAEILRAGFYTDDPDRVLAATPLNPLWQADDLANADMIPGVAAYMQRLDQAENSRLAALRVNVRAANGQDYDIAAQLNSADPQTRLVGETLRLVNAWALSHGTTYDRTPPAIYEQFRNQAAAALGINLAAELELGALATSGDVHKGTDGKWYASNTLAADIAVGIGRRISPEALAMIDTRQNDPAVIALAQQAASQLAAMNGRNVVPVDSLPLQTVRGVDLGISIPAGAQANAYPGAPLASVTTDGVTTTTTTGGVTTVTTSAGTPPGVQTVAGGGGSSWGDSVKKLPGWALVALAAVAFFALRRK